VSAPGAARGGPTSGSAGLFIRSGYIKKRRPVFVVSGQDIWNRQLSGGSGTSYSASRT
jgi:hypothetical protein